MVQRSWILCDFKVCRKVEILRIARERSSSVRVHKLTRCRCWCFLLLFLFLDFDPLDFFDLTIAFVYGDKIFDTNRVGIDSVFQIFVCLRKTMKTSHSWIVSILYRIICSTDKSFVISAYWFPRTLCLLKIILSSSSTPSHGWTQWLCHLSRHCLPTRLCVQHLCSIVCTKLFYEFTKQIIFLRVCVLCWNIVR